MTDYLVTHWSEIENVVTDLMTPDEKLGLSFQQVAMKNLFAKIADISSSLEEKLFKEANDNNDLVLDLEHIIAVGTERIDMEKLPEELRGLTKEEYLEKLAEVVKRRRGQKDLAAVYRTIKQRCGNIVNFIGGMDGRRYEIRYKNPNFSAQSETVPQDPVPMDRESEKSGIIKKSVLINVTNSRDQNNMTRKEDTAYVSRNYPH